MAPKGKGFLPFSSSKNSESVNRKLLPSKLQETESENSIQLLYRLERVQERGLRAAFKVLANEDTVADTLLLMMFLGRTNARDSK